MTIPCNSMARVIYRDALACRELPEVAIASLAGIDRVPLDEARRRFQEAQEQHDRRAQAEYNRRWRKKEALERVKWSILCQCVNADTVQDMGVVPVTERLLLDLAIVYQQCSHARREPDAKWVKSVFKTMQQEGLIQWDVTGLHLTDQGRAHYQWVMTGAKKQTK